MGKLKLIDSHIYLSHLSKQKKNGFKSDQKLVQAAKAGRHIAVNKSVIYHRRHEKKEKVTKWQENLGEQKRKGLYDFVPRLSVEKL